MYAQITTLRAPLNKMAELRRLIEQEYLPNVFNRDGFVSAQLLEQIDDTDNAQLIMFWDSQAAVERAGQTGLLRQTLEGLAIGLPGLKIQRQGYIVRVAVDQMKEAVRA